MPFKEGQSEFPRANAEALHPDSMDAANAYGVVIDGRPGPRWFNYQVQLCVTPRGTWIACWIQGASESFSGQRVVAARSTDNGKTRSKELVIEPGAEERQGTTLSMEISSICDDMTDNFFLRPGARFPHIEEDEPPWHLLCTEYPEKWIR